MTIIPFESIDTRRIRIDIITLTQELHTVETQITDFRRAMYAFDREYQNRLGDLAEAVLVLRAQLGIDDRNSTSDLPAVITHLADREYQQLKRAYRQAAKLCHPDHLSTAHKEAGLHLFDTLNKAYHLQDLTTVEHVLWLLQSGQAFSKTPVVISSEALLNKQKSLLTHLIVQKKDQLNQLKMCEDYDVSNKDNWNILLYDYQTRLEDELALLRGRANAVVKHSKS